MYLSINTIKAYIRSAYRKIGVSTRTHACVVGNRARVPPETITESSIGVVVHDAHRGTWRSLNCRDRRCPTPARRCHRARVGVR